MAVVRVLLTVVVAAALVAVAVPLVEDARRETARTAGERALDRVADGVRALVARSDPTTGPGARRTVTVRVPGATAGRMAVRWVAVGGLPGPRTPAEPPGTDLLAYRVAGSVRVLRLTAADLRVRTAEGRLGDGEPLVLRGRTRLVLRYRTGPTGPVVVVSAERS